MTKEKAIEIATKYISDRKRTCDRIVEDPVQFETNEEVIYGKYNEEFRDLWTVSYEIEGFDGPISYYVVVDDKSEEVLYTMTPNGYAEDWEEDITEL